MSMSGGSTRWRDVGAIDATFWELRQTCALGRVLEIGCGTGQFVQRLIELGVDAFGIEASADAIREVDAHVPGRCIVWSSGPLPCADAEFDTVICLDWLTDADESDVDRLIPELRRVTSRHVCVRVQETDARDRFSRTREWWDARFIQAGFRRHPALLRVVDYSTLDRESRGMLLLYERVPDAALAAYPLARLAEERDLHMDMLREAGRRSDAHLQRYAAAANLVRVGEIGRAHV